MPNTIVHGVIPYALASIFTKNKVLRWIALIGGMFPDLDGIHLFFDLNLYHIYHREVLHPLIYGFLIALPVAIIVNKLYKIKVWKTYLAFSLGFAIHSITDVFFTDWYVRLFWPFWNEKFSYPILMQFNLILALLVSIFIFIKLYSFLKSKKTLKEEIASLFPKNKTK